MASVFQRATKFLSIIQETIIKSIYFRFPPENLAPVSVYHPPFVPDNHETKSLTELLKESILWAVPKKRRTIEKRRTRRFGHSKYQCKLLLPKSNIIICDDCGSYKEAGLLCPHCYSKIRSVTEEMQEAIQKQLGVSPVENEVVVLYSDDKREDPEFYQGKRIIEMKKERPKLFCDNLLQKTTQAPATTAEVAPKKEIS